ncbi:4120_t:CDS:1 [Ambispora leptoticha]|uniref:4120_t:CDS:1 n=1 Tax=Ambispora leptoticha TaxID=144679 RepID=A0A9N9N8J2_9GLOM|nr:4120_t:CDS:1 [Ambispora leptoticha]
MTVPRNFMKIMKENTNIQITKIKQKIQQLINQNTAENEAQKKLLNYLFRKLDELKEIETMERLKEYAGGKYLKAYLLYKSIMRANYQPEHLNITNYGNSADYLKAIDSDIELLIKKDNKQPTIQPTSRQLLIMLGEKIKAGEVEFICGIGSGDILLIRDGQGEATMSLDLQTGKIEPDPVKELLEKHGWEDKEK